MHIICKIWCFLKQYYVVAILCHCFIVLFIPVLLILLYYLFLVFYYHILLGLHCYIKRYMHKGCFSENIIINYIFLLHSIIYYIRFLYKERYIISKRYILQLFINDYFYCYMF